MTAGDEFFKSATVVGLGLIGGSIARDLAAKGVRVRGYDADRAQLDAAVRDGIVSDPLDIDFDGVDADVIVLAVHKKRLVERALVSTTAERVIREANVPVLSIPTGIITGNEPLVETHLVQD